MTDKLMPMKAYAVLEKDERTGAIYFAHNDITARKAGANEYGDGELSYVTCNRAPYADMYAEDRIVPASVLIENGWHFECAGCRRQIDADFGFWQDRVGDDDTFAYMLQQARRYEHWTPSSVIGSQDSQVFCDEICKIAHDNYEAERSRRQHRAIEAFKRLVLKRFPDAKICADNDGPGIPTYRRKHHAYATKENGRWRVREISVAFEFPGMKIAPASLDYRYDRRSMSKDGKRERGKPAFQCCYGDQKAFEAWAKGGCHD